MDDISALNLDPDIAPVVRILRSAGVETYESCQGGPGHHGGAGEWPVVRFYGQQSEGFRALSVAMTFGLPVFELQRVWTIQDGEPTGPQWQLVFMPERLQAWLRRPLVLAEQICGNCGVRDPAHWHNDQELCHGGGGGRTERAEEG